MKKLNVLNLTLMAAVAICFIQIGAQLFTLVVVAGTVAEAPPRSFAMFQGEYGYNSSAFWCTLKPISIVLFNIALAVNWKTQRRKLMLLALALFLVRELVVGLFLEPAFDEMKLLSYRDEVDPILQSRAARWYALDWAVWGLGLVAGFALLLALIRPVTTPAEAKASSFHQAA